MKSLIVICATLIFLTLQINGKFLPESCSCEIIATPGGYTVACVEECDQQEVDEYVRTLLADKMQPTPGVELSWEDTDFYDISREELRQIFVEGGFKDNNRYDSDAYREAFVDLINDPEGRTLLKQYVKETKNIDLSDDFKVNLHVIDISSVLEEEKKEDVLSLKERFLSVLEGQYKKYLAEQYLANLTGIEQIRLVIETGIFFYIPSMVFIMCAFPFAAMAYFNIQLSILRVDSMCKLMTNIKLRGHRLMLTMDRNL